MLYFNRLKCHFLGFFTFFSLFMLPSVAFAQELSRDFLDVEVIRVIDGDTFRATLKCETDSCTDMGFFCENVSIRLSEVDTPELRGGCPRSKALAQQAKALFTELLDGKVDLIDCQRGTFYRYVCKVYANDKDVGEVLLSKALAQPYILRKKASWCK